MSDQNRIINKLQFLKEIANMCTLAKNYIFKHQLDELMRISAITSDLKNFKALYEKIQPNRIQNKASGTSFFIIEIILEANNVLLSDLRINKTLTNTLKNIILITLNLLDKNFYKPSFWVRLSLHFTDLSTLILSERISSRHLDYNKIEKMFKEGPNKTVESLVIVIYQTV